MVGFGSVNSAFISAETLGGALVNGISAMLSEPISLIRVDTESSSSAFDSFVSKWLGCKIYYDSNRNSVTVSNSMLRRKLSLGNAVTLKSRNCLGIKIRQTLGLLSNPGLQCHQKNGRRKINKSKYYSQFRQLNILNTCYA